jgi:hypothetical protein
MDMKRFLLPENETKISGERSTRNDRDCSHLWLHRIPKRPRIVRSLPFLGQIPSVDFQLSTDPCFPGLVKPMSGNLIFILSAL